jgi:hypothetical protein
MASDDFKIPEGLCSKGEAAAKALVKLAGPEGSGGGCRAFYSPQEWRDRGEQYGRDALLVVVHDGGDLAPMLNFDYCDQRAMNRQVAALAKLGLFAESCTGWYTAVYEG